MSATIHSITAKDYKDGLDHKARVDFLADVASEFLTMKGRGANRRPAVDLPESYAILFNRRVRQAAKLAAKEAEAVEAEVLAKAQKKAEKLEKAS